MKKQQIQQQEQLSAYDKKVIYDMFYMSIEWLEKYIEIAYKNEIPDWKNRKQIRDNITIKRTDIYRNPEKAKNAFATQVFLFGTSLEDTPLFREDLKKEFCQWISATKIDNNCPEELKHLLYGFNEVMDGNTEKVRKDMENRKREIEIDSPKYLEQMNKLFGNIQIPMDNERGTQKNLEGKTHLDMRIGNKFGSGNVEQGEQTFQQISGTVSASHSSGFHFYPQKGQSISPQQITNAEIIQDVKQNPRSWRIDEIVTGYDNRGRAVKKEKALIHNLAEVSFDGVVVDAQQPVYLIQRFNSEEKTEIERALGISQSSSTVQATQNLIEEIKRNIHEFEFQTILTSNGHRYDKISKRWVKYGDGKKETMLVHKSVQISENDYNEFGYLSIQQDKMFQEHIFNQEEWTEIKKALENSKIVERVNQNDWVIATVNSARDGSYEALINKSAIKGTSLKEGGEFYNKVQFSDEEWAKIKIIQDPLNQQQHSNKLQTFSICHPDQSNYSNTGLVITFLGLSVLLVASVVRKKLGNRSKV